MILVIWLGIAFSIRHYMEIIYPVREYIMDEGNVYLSSYNKWLGGEWYTMESTLFYMLIPILCALPYGASWLYDCKSSIGGQAIVRGRKADFVWTKMLVSFLNGAVIVMLPLVFDFVLTSSTLPAIIPKAGMGLSPISADSLLAELFYTYPLVYTLIYIGINGLFFGLLNTLSMAARFFTKNRYITVLTPFLYYMAFYCAGTTSGHLEWVPSGFIRPSQPFKTTWFIMIFEILLIIIISGVSAVRFIREEEGLL